MLLPLAPAASLGQRFPQALLEVLEEVLEALELPAEFVASEIEGVKAVVYAKTSNHSVLGMMNEFTRLAEVYRDAQGLSDALALSLKLAHTPCGPLYKGPVFPDKAVRWLVDGIEWPATMTRGGPLGRSRSESPTR